MSRKKTAISPSFIQCSRVRPPIFLCQKLKYSEPIGEFVMTSERMVQTISRFPPDFPDSKNLLKVFDSVIGIMCVDDSVDSSNPHGCRWPAAREHARDKHRS